MRDTVSLWLQKLSHFLDVITYMRSASNAQDQTPFCRASKSILHPARGLDQPKYQNLVFQYHVLLKVFSGVKTCMQVSDRLGKIYRKYAGSTIVKGRSEGSFPKRMCKHHLHCNKINRAPRLAARPDILGPFSGRRCAWLVLYVNYSHRL